MVSSVRILRYFLSGLVTEELVMDPPTDEPDEISSLLFTGRMKAANVPPFEVDKEVGKNDLQYSNAEGGLKDARLAEADDDGRWPPRAGDLPHSYAQCLIIASTEMMYFQSLNCPSVMSLCWK